MEKQQVGKDPWAHRSEGMKCRTCMWFAQKGSSVVGRCRRHAPTMSGYPVVFDSDWCGDHKLDEKLYEYDDIAKKLFSGIDGLNILHKTPCGKDTPCEGKPGTQIKE